MSLPTASFWITLLWLIIYAVKYTSRRPRSLLPSSHNRRLTTELTVKHLNIRLKTEAFNVFHDKLSTWLSHNDSQILRQILLKLYDLGSLLGVIGMLLGFSLLFLTVASLSSEILHAGRNHSANTVTKREFDYVADPTTPTAPASDLLRINPIVSIPFKI